MAHACDTCGLVHDGPRPLLPDSEKYRGDTPEEVEAHLVFEAQLRHTVAMVASELDEHFHFADDCGDYLKAALRLCSLMQDARTDGPRCLLENMRGLLTPAPDYDPFPGDEPIDKTLLRMDYAGDGVCSELFEWAEKELQK